ncbi:phosphotransferase [Kitasatospora sp. NPDC047058]|uniref:phosphotransferase n=1 Tax=Kitasatospora sp. NPDC047058 TaxID=3155620 RepID=UPI0033F34146
MKRRLTWQELPEAVRCAVAGRAGAPPLAVEDVPFGLSSHFAAVLHFADGRRVFCKGMEDGRDARLQCRVEAAANPYVAFTSPALLWDVSASGWRLLGFAYVRGRIVDLSPGSPDLPAVARVLAGAADRLTPAPEVGTLPLSERWARFTAWEQLAAHDALDPWVAARLDDLRLWEKRGPGAVVGDTLAHCDLSRYNLLVDAGLGVHVVDWARAGRAACWVDTAFMVLRLIGEGHTPASAERWARTVRAWEAAGAEDVTAFAVATAGIRAVRAARPGAPPHLALLAAHALAWCRHLLG